MTVHDGAFERVYERDDPAFIERSSPVLRRYVRAMDAPGRAIDLGSGSGRNTLLLAEAGFDVLAIDVCPAALTCLEEEAQKRGLSSRIDTRVQDLRETPLPEDHYRMIVAATSLDHVPRADVPAVIERIASALDGEGLAFFEVHTVDDPGFTGRGPVSECASQIAHYFEPGELFALCRPHLRMVSYQERTEWDRTHGPDHRHGKAVAVGIHPDRPAPLLESSDT